MLTPPRSIEDAVTIQWRTARGNFRRLRSAEVERLAEAKRRGYLRIPRRSEPYGDPVVSAWSALSEGLYRPTVLLFVTRVMAAAQFDAITAWGSGLAPQRAWNEPRVMEIVERYGIPRSRYYAGVFTQVRVEPRRAEEAAAAFAAHADAFAARFPPEATP